MARIQNVIIRSKADPIRSMQLQIDMDEGTIGIVMSKGMEILFIEKAHAADIKLTSMEDKPEKSLVESLRTMSERFPDNTRGKHHTGDR